MVILYTPDMSKKCTFPANASQIHETTEKRAYIFKIIKKNNMITVIHLQQLVMRSISSTVSSN